MYLVADLMGVLGNGRDLPLQSRAKEVGRESKIVLSFSVPSSLLIEVFAAS